MVELIRPRIEGNGADVPVVTIVGIQGLGKTTLAKLVCADERLKAYFDLVIWINGIHEEFFAESIVKRMIHESATKKKKLELEDKDSVVIEANLNLGEAMSGRRFFLVLDDFRSNNREEWLKLHHMLVEAASSSGGAVLVTTRSDPVANAIGPLTWKLSPLDEYSSWDLFERSVEEGPCEYRDAQRKMVNKCNGIPAAILTMARLWRSWQAVSDESQIEYLEKNIIGGMWLLYYSELPSLHLKQCFAYLSLIFSEASLVKPEILIRLWMAEGFLGLVDSNSSPLQQPQPEDLGFDCIQEFGRRSILLVTEDECGVMTYCSLSNELMLELSTFVAGKDDRRVSLARDFDVSNGIPKSLDENNKGLRTILFSMPNIDGWSSRTPYAVKLSWSACNKIFSRYKSLRVLSLSDLGMKMIPISIGELKNLRYLDLSHNNMKKLPNSIVKLKLLQTLKLSHCHELRELPNGVEHLVSLRHLDVEECLNLTHMPSSLKKLTNLQTLSHFVVGTSNKHKHILSFGELFHLKNLRGELEISHLERLTIKEPEQDRGNYLNEKQHLKWLTLKWNHDDHNHESNQGQMVLGQLEPHPNLQGLCVVGCRDSIVESSSLEYLKNLVKLTLYNCSTVKYLPSLAQFTRLKILQLKILNSLEYITNYEDYHHNLGLGVLRELSISDCPKLTTWWEHRTYNPEILFGCISRLEVKYCPKLDCMPLYPNLDCEVVLEGSNMNPLIETIYYSSASNSRMPSDLDSNSNSSPPLSKLTRLEIKNVDEPYQVPGGWTRNLISLQYLWISEKKSPMKGFRHLTSLTSLIITKCKGDDLGNEEWEGLKRLEYLQIEEVAELWSLPEGIKHLTSLTSLIIKSCPELATLTEGISNLESLEQLVIEECPELASLPQGMMQLDFLDELRIRNCPCLLPRCQVETGDDWQKIKHIRDIRLM